MAGPRPRSALALAIVALAACGPATPAQAPEAKVVARNLVPPPGTTLVAACTPTGPELCFNAIDDNCNDVIDEGCGVRTGLLQVTIAWGSNPADVNLSLELPSTPANPQRVDKDSKSSASGFHFDHDCPGSEGCSGQNQENVFFDGLEPPHGHYVVRWRLGDLHGADPPVKARIGARLGSRTVGFDVELAPGDDAEKAKFEFDVP